MGLGKSFFVMVGAVFLLAGAPARGGDLSSGSADAALSIRKNAHVSIGGEIMTDIVYRKDKHAGTDNRIELRRSNLRIDADILPTVTARFKLDFSERENDCDPEILAEAMLVMDSLCGTGLELFAGKGRAPYGQDVTLGIIQSYHHTADRVDGDNGRVFITDPPRAGFVNSRFGPGAVSPAPPRPGQLDRVLMAGLAYEWDDRVRIEAAVFDSGELYRQWRRNGYYGDDEKMNDLGFAGRLWWRPMEDLSMEVSAAFLHSSEMGRREYRADLSPSSRPAGHAWSVSAGFDWRPGPWRVFGEFQKAWDWGFLKDYRATIAQLGAAREFASRWRIGAMGEYMRLSDPLAGGIKDDYYKLALNIKYTISDGFFILAEYGYEKLRRERHGLLDGKNHGDFIGVRIGFMF